jgi:hypothetical protein
MKARVMFTGLVAISIVVIAIGAFSQVLSSEAWSRAGAHANFLQTGSG